MSQENEFEDGMKLDPINSNLFQALPTNNEDEEYQTSNNYTSNMDDIIDKIEEGFGRFNNNFVEKNYGIISFNNIDTNFPLSGGEA